ncbi:MAG: thiamine diphosphokinase [Clostridiales bacterium]|jgi:thiamine pyrophosphokinase|nr:thiamine diphosphokinase [Clostridiales bacterium]
MAGTCFIFGAGEYYADPVSPREGDFIIAADGGYAYLNELGASPDLIIGDFDSLPAPPEGREVITLSPLKDDTDVLAAIKEGWARGFRRFCVYGGTGGRIDHTLANIACVAGVAQQGGRAWLYDKTSVITAVHNGAMCFPAGLEGYISIFAYTDEAEGVCARGFKYELEDARLVSTFPKGVSNEFDGRQARVSVARGTIVIIYPKK